MMAALVLPPYSSPSQKPAPMATTFLSAPHSSTPGTSPTTLTRKVDQSKTFFHTSPVSGLVAPTVDSQNWSCATSLATLAPIRTEMSMPPIVFEISSEMSCGLPCSNSMPLISETPRALAAYIAFMLGTVLGRNWCGMTKTRSVAPVTALARSGSAITFSGSLTPLRYLTFSCVSLMISESFLPSIISSKTHMFTSVSMSSWRAALKPMMRAIAEPQLPDPMMAIFSLVAAMFV
mmetsp:Transcript_7475/g.19419  ORF Transcript_7475/g.19419 Transcript_7475/m.19419 type:complete len:234 (-) Transcript_7475:108-809(-)